MQCAVCSVQCVVCRLRWGYTGLSFNVYTELNFNDVSNGVCTDVHQCLCSMFTNGILIENKCFIRASRHWQALFKRMNGQVIASV